MRHLSKLIALSALGIFLTSLAYRHHYVRAAFEPQASVPSALDLRPRFSLTDGDGRQVGDADLQGRPVLMTFGRVGCGEPCRDFLAEEAAALESLGAKGDAAAFLFVTLDPRTDTPDRLARFTGGIDPRLEALGGSPAAVADAASAFRFVHGAVEAWPGFPIMTYMLGPKGRLRQILPSGMKAPEIAALLESVIDES